MNAFWQLLEEKPYTKITVKDIVDICEINRNTFYYHFHDIPELLETILKKNADYVIHTYGRLVSPLDCLTPLVESCINRQKAILHIYCSINREIFLKELDRILLYAVTEYINTSQAARTLSSDDKKMYIWYYKCTLTGIVLDWLNDGMQYDVLASFAALHDLLNDTDKKISFQPAESVSELT